LADAKPPLDEHHVPFPDLLVYLRHAVRNVKLVTINLPIEAAPDSLPRALLQPGKRRQETPGECPVPSVCGLRLQSHVHPPILAMTGPPARIHRLGTRGALRRLALGGARTIRNNEIGHRVYLI
jgi:hypothetical protein